MSDQSDDVERAASTAVVPVHTSPPPSEWQTMMAIADMLAMSDMVPAGYRRKPANVVLAALTGRGLGWDVTTAMRFVHIVEGKPTISAEGMVALVRRAGHSIGGSTTPTEATATGKRHDTGDEMSVTWTLQAAKDAGLAGKDVWKRYPSAMCWARAVSQLCRMLFPDVLLGTSYTAEELGDTDWIDGDAAPEEQTVSPEVQRRIDLRAAIDGFDAEDRARLGAWCDETGTPRRVMDMTDAQVVGAAAIVAGLGAITDAVVVEEAPVRPVEPPEPVAATDRAPLGSAAATGREAVPDDEWQPDDAPASDEQDRIEMIRAWVETLDKPTVTELLAASDPPVTHPAMASITSLRKLLREALSAAGFVVPAEARDELTRQDPPGSIEEAWSRYLVTAGPHEVPHFCIVAGVPYNDRPLNGPEMARVVRAMVATGEWPPSTLVAS